ncbi:MAG: hypothetical protein RMJ56_03905 [Gemmataceae bacterium]|nr:hypothetical protein [Gemmata sp.]MDW8196734.1 hypothetical protein [Gemmataceae bacterium]
MTPIRETACGAETAPVLAALETAAERMLRDVAYVLRLTRRIKAEMLADRSVHPQPAVRRAEGVLVA